MQTPLFLRLFGPNVPHHHWGPKTYVSYSMPNSMQYFTARIIKFLFWYLRCKKYWLRPTSKWEVSLHEDLENQLHSNKRTQSLLNLESIGLTWFQESNLSHQCRINFYQTHTCSSLLLAFMIPLTTSVTVHVIAQKITVTTHVKPQWAKS